ncbi:MAG TPA: 50S ribosomal protein L25 [Candidatus Eisenbacteria bacterium]|jgi:large subunit ribosomal protein L25|nr:50S ribosomal protein L25 [Candidatus Eisenbacteria bacterium]
MAIVTLKSTRRDGVGKGVARRLREAGSVPAIYYGRGEAPVAISVHAKELETLLHGASGSNVIVDLKVEGADAADRKAILREVQRHPVRGTILHVDLQHISLSERITVEVPVVLVGVPTGVKDGGGILEHILREVEVECLPTDIPEKFTVDVSHLNIGDSVHVSDINFGNVEVLTETDRSVATVVPPTVLEEVKPAEGAPAEPELVKKEKGSDEEGEKES